MPRKVRELADDSIYHVFNRGNNRRNLFHDAEDFNFFLSRFDIIKLDINFDIYHYCIMKNHFHFLIKIERSNDLPKIMHRCQLSYARYFKKKYDFVGHVFQERFRSPRIPNESYYLQCGRYIERNPVKANLVIDAWQYKYSSAQFYSLGKENYLIKTDPYYEELGMTNIERQLAYRKFLLIDEPYSKIIEASLIKV